MAAGSESVEISGLEMKIYKGNVRFEKENCMIVVPYGNVSSIGKNQLKLIVFLIDPDAVQEEQYDDDEEEDEENAHTGLELIMLNMLRKINQNLPFMNALKGNFTVQLSFSSEEELALCRAKMEERIAEIEKTL